MQRWGSLGSKYFSFQWVYNTYCPLHKNYWQRKPSLASGLRPRPRRFTAINSDVVDNNYNMYNVMYIHILRTLSLLNMPWFWIDTPWCNNYYINAFNLTEQVHLTPHTHTHTTQLKDLRSQVVREASITLSLMATLFTSEFSFFAELMLPQLIALLSNSAKVMASSAEVCLKMIIKVS